LFREFYCDEPKCNCRRVLIQVSSAERNRVVATISYGLVPSKSAYHDEPQMFLDPMNPQSSASAALMNVFQAMIASDDDYRGRLVGHYEMWKSVVDDPTHPNHAKVRSAAHDDPTFRPAFSRPASSLRRTEPKVGPNDPCPCGSGKKFKRCCRP